MVNIKWMMFLWLVAVVGLQLTSAPFTSAAPTCTTSLCIFDHLCPNWKETTDAWKNLLGKDEIEMFLCSKFVCPICERLAQHYNNITWQATESIVDLTCDLMMIICFHEHNNFCKSIVQEFKDEIITVFERLKPHEVCGFLINKVHKIDCGSCKDPFSRNWTVPIPGNKPPIVPPPNLKIPSNSSVVRILHLTDFHWDPKYTPGLTNECGEPLCCREGNDKGSGDTAAGYWGDYKCDIPFHTLENLFQHLATIKDQFDFVYITGDIPAHNVWDITQEEAISSLQQLVNLFNKHLPGKAVFPTFGNHESVPVNSFPPSFINGSHSLDWLLEPTVNLWGSLSKLPAPEWEKAKRTILRGGFYSVNATQNLTSKLRVISLQTNYCNNENFWLLINSTDPDNQLRWLVEQLSEAERANDKVHIIGHIPPGNKDCLEVWSNIYYKIVNRFESTIVGQFMGHTHKDSFSIFYDEKNTSRATNVLFIAPGVTSYKGLNLGFRIYTIDSSSYALIDHDSYYMNLTEANKNNIPKWQHEYSAKSAYNMTGVTPADWDQLVKKFQKNDTLFQEYYRNHYKRAPVPPYDCKCKSQMLCDLVSSRSGDSLKCQAENHKLQVCNDNYLLNKPMLFSTEF